jgi:hypothetical protein
LTIESKGKKAQICKNLFQINLGCFRMYGKIHFEYF